MEILFTDSPAIQQEWHANSINHYFNNLVDTATHLNIATGYITNDSIAALKQIVEFRKGALKLSLFIGMHYAEGFTKPQYKALKELGNYMKRKEIGQIMLSPHAPFHGKMYSFMNNEKCLASFIGSSNLGSFTGTSQNNIEADVMLKHLEGIVINDYIGKITNSLGQDILLLPEITKFKTADKKLLRGFSHVKQLNENEVKKIADMTTGEYVDIPLKTEAKSNLNTYFGKGKQKDKYSPRGWYEVEIIVNKNLKNRELIPSKEAGPFTVVTNDGYEFLCSTQGDYSKNFRSDKNLKILGKWIKGQMENAGALKIGQPVTKETLEKFGKKHIRLEKTNSAIFLMSLVP